MSLKPLVAVATLALDALPGPRPPATPVIAEAVASASEEATCTGEWATLDFCTPVWSGPPEKLVVAEVAVGWFESGFQERIQAGRCRKYECDAKYGPGGVFLGHRARSYWQLQKTSFVAPFWDDMVGSDPMPTFEAARGAARVLGAGYKRCHSLGGAVSWYATHDCSAADKRAAYAELLFKKTHSSGQ